MSEPPDQAERRILADLLQKANDRGGDYRFLWTPDYSRPVQPAGVWVGAVRDDLPMTVWLRISRDPAGRFVVTGLMMGDEFNPHEITSQTLRLVKPREILAALFQDYDPESSDWRTFAGSVDLLTRVNVDADARHAARGGPRGPDEETLQAFARTYRTELARQPQRAMTAAARAHQISRVTAHRWAKECRERGYLPGGTTHPNTTE